MKSLLIAIVAGLAGCITACSVGPDYSTRSAGELGVPDRYVGAAKNRVATDVSAWWTAFDDPVLTELIDRALAANPDIAQSISRVLQARESLAQTRGGTLPQISTSARDGRNINSGAPDSWAHSRSIDANWTVDLFGGQLRSIEAARAFYESAGFSLANAQALLAAEVARNYVDMRSARIRLGVAQASLDVQDSNVQIADWRAQAGLVSSIDVEQARSQRAQTAALLPLLEQSEAQTRFRLSVLTGAAPGSLDALIAGQAALPALPSIISAGAPVELLRRRPDVRRAERDLAAATARIGIATAQLYPALSLSGSAVTNAPSFSNLLDVLTSNLFSNLSGIIFDGGQRRAEVRWQTVAAEGALAAYRSAILVSLEDVENARPPRSGLRLCNNR
jgi:outer membrane protein, multidrug efflux system